MKAPTNVECDFYRKDVGVFRGFNLSSNSNSFLYL